MLGYDIIFSVVFGGILSLVIITNGSSKKAIEKRSDTETEVDVNDGVSSKILATQIPLINESKFNQKSKKFQELIGLSEEQIHTAVELTNNSIKVGDVRSEDDVTWFSILDSLIFVSLICFSLYFINVVSHGDFGRMLLALFPKEFESLKLTEYIRNYHLHDQT